MREVRQRPDGWRTLRVGALELWWHASPARVVARLEARVQELTVTLKIERADGSGKTLVATLRAERPLGLGGAPPVLALEPAMVRRVVERAAPRAAWPTGRGTWSIELAERELG